MSLAYRANWITVSSNVTEGDTLSMDLSLLGILPSGEMAALLRDELAREGWRKNDDGALTKREGDMTLTLSPDGQKVDVKLEQTRKVTTQAESKKTQAAELARAEEAATRQMKAEAAAKLMQAEPDLRVKLGAAVQKVYAEALRQKAKTLGDVESVSEKRSADGEYEVTIKVKV